MNVLQVFNYNGSVVRTVEKDNEVWFVAKDVCEVLDIQNATQAVQSLDEDERAMYYIGRQGEANIINEPGMYKLIFKSRKAEGKEFTRWIFSKSKHSSREVLSFIYNEDALDCFKQYKEGLHE